MMPKISLLIFFLLIGPTLAAQKLTMDLVPEKSPVEFLAIGRPAAIKIKGTGSSTSGSITWDVKGVSGELILDLKKFETGLDLRDEHMKEKYLEISKEGYSITKLIVKEMSIGQSFFEKDQEIKDQPFKGILNLHGVSKEITGSFSAKYDGKKSMASGTADFRIKLSDFSIEIPSFSGITVAEDVVITVEYLAKVSKN